MRSESLAFLALAPERCDGLAHPGAASVAPGGHALISLPVPPDLFAEAIDEVLRGHPPRPLRDRGKLRRRPLHYLQIEQDRAVVGGAGMERAGGAADDPSDQAAIEAEAHDVRRVGGPARTDIVEARQDRRAEGVEVADDRGGTLDMVQDSKELAP